MTAAKPSTDFYNTLDEANRGKCW